MAEADFSGDYINADNTHKNDILEIVDKPIYADIKLKQKDGSEKIKKVVNIKVSNNGKTKIYTPSSESGKRMVKAWGSEMDNWVGMKLVADEVSYKSFGETKTMIETTPLKAEKV